MAEVSVQWTPRFLVAMTEDEAVAVSNALGEMALEGRLEDAGLDVWRRISSMTIEANEMRIGD